MATETEFLVDSSVFIAHIRLKRPSTLQKAELIYGVPIASEASLFELEVGALKVGRHAEYMTHFSAIPLLAVDRPIWLEAAAIQVELVRVNQIIDVIDTIIAATARVHQLPLLTLNTKHFQRVAGIQLLPIPT